MRKTSIRLILLGFVLAVVLLYTGNGLGEKSFYGYMTAEVVQEVPKGAPVTNAVNLDFSKSNELETLLNKSVDHPDKTSRMKFKSEQSYEQTQRLLTKEMYHEGAGGSGYYIKKDGVVVKVNTVVLL